MEECHPIELLINLVISEQMDPWDIDIVKITERFLREINRMRELNLKFGGKFLLATSFLLRLKSESLLEEKEEDEELPFESENEVTSLVSKLISVNSELLFSSTLFTPSTI